uniref:Uncharacterized protein n=1 Tax=uncultured marine virus TaxID=186617 RepID=A0A0F7L9N5_9VIRU|nr:hypothetical protein [uncultured marine virus]
MSFPFVQPYFGLGNSLQTAQAGGGAVGGWVEIARTTLGSEGDNITVSSLPDKRYYMILGDVRDGTGDHGIGIRLNGDTGSNYASRWSINGTTDQTAASKSSGYITESRQYHNYNVTYLSNLSSKEKLWQNQNVHQLAAGAATAPMREEAVGKWANTSNAVDEFTYYNWHSGDFGTGSEAVVLGWDPADTHTTNFWEELASVELGSANANISSGTISAKKYLWIQAWFNCGSANDIRITFNSDSGNNYSHRMQQNGGSDVTYTSQDDLRVNYSTTLYPTFVNLFMVNNASNEKLITGHMTNTGGSGGSVVPDRRIEFAGKWTNTSDQITSMNFYRGAGLNDYNSGTILKVWGSD